MLSCWRGVGADSFWCWDTECQGEKAEGAEQKTRFIFTSKAAMNIVVLDGFTLNPGDLSWGGFQAARAVRSI